jgi:hypothetical protein
VFRALGISTEVQGDCFFQGLKNDCLYCNELGSLHKIFVDDQNKFPEVGILSTFVFSSV